MPVYKKLSPGITPLLSPPPPSPKHCSCILTDDVRRPSDDLIRGQYSDIGENGTAESILSVRVFFLLIERSLGLHNIRIMSYTFVCHACTVFVHTHASYDRPTTLGTSQYTCTHTRIHKQTHTHERTHARTQTHSNKCTHTNARTKTHAHKRTHSRTRAITHTCCCRSSRYYVVNLLLYTVTVGLNTFARQFLGCFFFSTIFIFICSVDPMNQKIR